MAYGCRLDGPLSIERGFRPASASSWPARARRRGLDQVKHDPERVRPLWVGEPAPQRVARGCDRERSPPAPRRSPARSCRARAACARRRCAPSPCPAPVGRRRAVGASTGDPLAAFLPDALPAGVRLYVRESAASRVCVEPRITGRRAGADRSERSGRDLRVSLFGVFASQHRFSIPDTPPPNSGAIVYHGLPWPTEKPKATNAVSGDDTVGAGGYRRVGGIAAMCKKAAIRLEVPDL